MSNVKLNPCPFCGSVKLSIREEFVECDMCGCSGPYNFSGVNMTRVINEWNTRHNEDKVTTSLCEHKDNIYIERGDKGFHLCFDCLSV